jgi:DNA-binding response OmpR family regulator
MNDEGRDFGPLMLGRHASDVAAMVSPQAIDMHLSGLRTKLEWEALTKEQIEALGDASQPLSEPPDENPSP